MFTEFLSSVLSGGATGLIGAAVSKYADYKNKQLDIEVDKLKFQNELDLRHIDERMMIQEWNMRDKIATTESEGRSDVADSEAFKAALTSEPKMYSDSSKTTLGQNWMLVILDFIRGIIRPGLTLYLCAVTTAVYLQAGSIIKHQQITSEQAVEMYSQISATILYLCTTCVLFWFGVRNKESKKAKQ